MTNKEAVNWLINLTADIGKPKHRDLWHYEQALHEIREMLEGDPAQPEIIYCKDCKHWEKTCGDNQWSLGNCGLFEKRLVMCKGYCAWAKRRTDGSD